VCNDGPGFIVNRILMPYLSEACRVLEEGGDLEAMDAAVARWGVPMGPAMLMDTIGLDVMTGIFEAMSPKLGERVRASELLNQCVAAGQLGRKSGAGLYLWPSEKGAKPTPNAERLQMFRVEHSDVDLTAERFVLLMCNEAARALDEGVAESPDDIDLATLLGTGLAPWRGGIHRHIYDLGRDELVRQLESLAERHGERFEPAAKLGS
ncbi:MAG: 3-hydroxyacyl-CoA dehydrogenase family protein, partial [Planctomycetota bacterium]